MNVYRPHGILAGFAVENAGESAEFVHAGEQWVPRTFKISSHSHAHCELYLQMSGESLWRSANTTYNVRQNALFIAPPAIVHSMDDAVQARCHFMFASFDVNAVLSRLSTLTVVWPRDRVILIENAVSAVAPFRHLIREVSLNLDYRDAGIRAALDSLVISASRLLVGADSPGNTGNAYEHGSVTYAKRLIDEHPIVNGRLLTLPEWLDSRQDIWPNFSPGIPVYLRTDTSSSSAWRRRTSI